MAGLAKNNSKKKTTTKTTTATKFKKPTPLFLKHLMSFSMQQIGQCEKNN